MQKIIVPKLGVNDDKIMISDWLVNENDYVDIGQDICLVETAKTVFEVATQFKGYIKIIVNMEEEVNFDQCIAIITDSPQDEICIDDYKTVKENYGNQSSSDKSIDKYTKKALEYAAKNNIDITSIHKDGLITLKDVMIFFDKKNNIEKKHKLKHRMNNRNGIALYGTGMGAMVHKAYIEDEGKYEIIYYVDDYTDEIEIDGIPIIRRDDLELIKENIIGIACFIANNKFRLQIRKVIEKLDLKLISIISKNISIRKDVKIGQGVFIKDGAVIGVGCKIDDCCIIDNNVTVAHHSHLKEGCFLAPGVTLGGGVTIGELSVLAISSSIVSRITIGKNVIVSAGSSVHFDVPSNNIVEGVPAGIIGKTKI